MKIDTDIYRGNKGNYWKVTHDGIGVIIEQAIDPTELINQDPYEKAHDNYKGPEQEVLASQCHPTYNKSGVLVAIEKPVGSNLSRKV